ncbi:MAG: WbqC family protein [Bacteroidota bacterium]
MTAVRPPEYFPRQEVAALFLAADRFVLADTLPFSRQAAHNRARIRTSSGRQWLTVPREHAGRPISLDRLGIIADGWQKRHIHALKTAYGMAPFVDHVLPEIEALLARDWPTLGALTVATCQWTHRWLGAGSELVLASSLPGRPNTLGTIWEAAGTDCLLALEESAARDSARLGTEAGVLRYSEAERRQAFEGFVPGCSSLDVILNHGPRAADVILTGATSQGTASPR